MKSTFQSDLLYRQLKKSINDQDEDLKQDEFQLKYKDGQFINAYWHSRNKLAL